MELIFLAELGVVEISLKTALPSRKIVVRGLRLILTASSTVLHSDAKINKCNATLNMLKRYYAFS